jgi:hypothetical protein
MQFLQLMTSRAVEALVRWYRQRVCSQGAQLMTSWADTCGVHTQPTYVTREKALDCFGFTLTAGNYRNQSVIETFNL